MSDGELVTIATFRTLGEAHVAKGALESEGIECFLTDETIAASYPAAVGIRLQVHAEDREQAKQILPPDEPEPEYEQPDQEVCPKCGSAEIHFVEKSLFSSDPPHWKCDQCR